MNINKEIKLKKDLVEDINHEILEVQTQHNPFKPWEVSETELCTMTFSKLTEIKDQTEKLKTALKELRQQIGDITEEETKK